METYSLVETTGSGAMHR